MGVFVDEPVPLKVAVSVNVPLLVSVADGVALLDPVVDSDIDAVIDAVCGLVTLGLTLPVAEGVGRGETYIYCVLDALLVADAVDEPLPVRLNDGVPVGLWALKFDGAGLALGVPEIVPDCVPEAVTLGVKVGVRVTVCVGVG